MPLLYSKAIHYPNAPSSHYPNATPQMLQNPRQLIQLLFTTPFLLTIFGLLAFSQRLDNFSPSIIDSFNTSNMKILYLLHQLHNLAHIGSLLCFTPLVMACCEQLICTSYKNRLKDVAKLLGLFEPLYGTLNGRSNVACVIILASKETSPYFKVGSVSLNLVDSEEAAAKHCFQSLVMDFGLSTVHLKKEICEPCHKRCLLDSGSYGRCREGNSIEIQSTSFALGENITMNCVNLIDETLSIEAQEECVTPTNSSSQISLLSTPPPPRKKRRLLCLPVVQRRTAHIIRLPSDLSTLFKKREGGH